MRLIANTGQEMRRPWPEDVHVQGGARGTVFTADGGSYRTAFVEAFPGTFLRGEGPTLAEAETACWEQYLVMRDCPHDRGFNPRGYTNGSGFCVLCGTWFSKVLPVTPEDPERVPGALEVAAKALEAEEGT